MGEEDDEYEGEEEEQDDETKIRALFHAWDENGDGVISYEELAVVFSTLGWKEDEIEALFEKADTNQDGTIGYEEFLTWIFSEDNGVAVEILEKVVAGQFPMRVNVTDTEVDTLKQATRDLNDKFSKITEHLGGGENLQKAVNALCLMMLDMDYSDRPNTKNRGEKFSMDQPDPSGGDTNITIRYLKHVANNIEELSQETCGDMSYSNVTTLMVRDCLGSVTSDYRNADQGKMTRYYHHFAWEACPAMKGKLLNCESSEWLNCEGHAGWEAVVNNPKEFKDFEPSTFTGFQFKSPSSCVNKMYCRPDCSNDNLYTDNTRSRLTVGSEEELKSMFEMLQKSCYFPNNMWKSIDLFKKHMELIHKMKDGDDSINEFFFRRDEKFSMYDCGPLPGTNLIIMKAYWNGICRALKKNIVFNLIYYIQCPYIMQSVEGFTLWANEMQIGTAEAFEEINKRHHEYDQMRVLSKCKRMQQFYKAAMAMSPENFAAIELDDDEQEAFSKHYKEFAELSIMVDENNVLYERDQNEDREEPYRIMTSAEHWATPDLTTFNYTGAYGEFNLSLIVWRWPPVDKPDEKKLRYIKKASVWAKDQGFGGAEGSALLVGVMGDFAHNLVPVQTVQHEMQEFSLVTDYGSTELGNPNRKIIGDLSSFDFVAICLRCCGYGGHEIHACGFEIEYVVDNGGSANYLECWGYLDEGGDLHEEEMTLADAKKKAAELEGCQGFCFEGEDTGEPRMVYFKDHFDFFENEDGEEWVSFMVC